MVNEIFRRECRSDPQSIWKLPMKQELTKHKIQTFQHKQLPQPESDSQKCWRKSPATDKTEVRWRKHPKTMLWGRTSECKSGRRCDSHPQGDPENSAHPAKPSLDLLPPPWPCTCPDPSSSSNRSVESHLHSITQEERWSDEEWSGKKGCRVKWIDGRVRKVLIKERGREEGWLGKVMNCKEVVILRVSLVCN